MSDKELLLKTIQNDIKNIDKCIEMCIDEESIEYLKSIQQNMREQEIEILKRITIDKMIRDEGIDYLKSIQQNMEEYELKIGKRMEFKKALKEHNYG